MTPTTATDPVEQLKANGLAALGFSRRVLNKLCEGIPAEKCTAQPFRCANHLTWICGHIATTDNFFLTTVGGGESRCPEEWNQLFGMGSEPVDDPSRYPPLSEVRAKMSEVRRALEQWFDSMDESELAEPLPENLKGFAPSKGALMSTLAAHESIHAGQLTDLRKALGLPRAMG